MTAEIIPFPEPPPHLDLPESPKKCLNLAKKIDGQLDRWVGYTHHPLMRTGALSLATFIAEDCQPLGRDPIDYSSEAGFGGTMTREEAQRRTEYERRRKTLSKWVLVEVLDDIPAYNKGLDGYLKTVAGFASNPGAPEVYRSATQALSRLHILREQLATRIGRVSTLDTSAFRELATKLDNDLM